MLLGRRNRCRCGMQNKWCGAAHAGKFFQGRDNDYGREHLYANLGCIVTAVHCFIWPYSNPDRNHDWPHLTDEEIKTQINEILSYGATNPCLWPQWAAPSSDELEHSKWLDSRALPLPGDNSEKFTTTDLDSFRECLSISSELDFSLGKKRSLESALVKLSQLLAVLPEQQWVELLITTMLCTRAADTMLSPHEDELKGRSRITHQSYPITPAWDC